MVSGDRFFCGGSPLTVRRSDGWWLAKVTLLAVRQCAASSSAFGNDGNLLKMVERRIYR